MKAGFALNIERLYGPGIIRAAAAHNLRQIAAEIGVDGHIDAARIADNFILRGPSSAKEVAALAKSLMEAAGVSKCRKGAVTALELLFTLPAATTIDARQYFEQATTWAEQHFGVPMLSCVAHMDEGAPHAHALLLPLVDGRMGGSDLHGGKAKLAAMQTSFHDAVGAPHGLPKYVPQKWLSAPVRTAAIALARETLQANAALNDDIIDALLVPHAKDPAPLLLALGITMPAPKPKCKDFVSIMTAVCKPEPKSPIGKGNRKPIGKAMQVAPLSSLPDTCVGKGNPTSPSSTNFASVSATNQRQPADNDLLKTEHVLPATATANRVPENLGAPRLTDHAAQAGAGQETWSDFKSEQSAISDATTAGHDIAPATPTPRARSNSSTSAPRTGFETVSLAQARGLRKISDTPEPIDHQGALAASKSKVGKSHFDGAGASQAAPGFSRFDIDTPQTNEIRHPSELAPPIGTPARQSAEISAHLSSPEFSGELRHGEDYQRQRDDDRPAEHWDADLGEFVTVPSVPARPPGRHGRAPYSARASPADITHELLALAGATEPKTPVRAESEP